MLYLHDENKLVYEETIVLAFLNQHIELGFSYQLIGTVTK